jgi:hypothetical protein
MAKIAVILNVMAGYLNEINWANGPEFEMLSIFSRDRCHPPRIVPLNERGTAGPTYSLLESHFQAKNP